MNSVFIQFIFFLFFISTWMIGFACVRMVRPGKHPADAFCINVCIWTLYLYICTELLSLFSLITFPSLLVVWIIYIALNVFVILRRRRTDVLNGVSGSKWHPARSLGGLFKTFAGDKLSMALLAILVIIVIRSAIFAAMTAPYNWDSMAYHLARIMFWIQNRSIRYYDTNVIRQLVSPVLAECINMHVITLCGGDQFVNMLQFFSACGCMVLLYSCIRRFGCTRAWSLMGCILAYTMNIFFAESTSTQVDMVGTLLLLIMVYILIGVVQSDRIGFDRDRILLFAVFGVCGGLLFITKSNALISAAVITLFVFCYRCYRRDKFIDLIRLALVGVVPALLMMAPTFIRNYRYCGDILASDYVGGISVGTASPPMLIINVLKNCSSVAVGRYSAPILTKCVGKMAMILGVDVNAPEISFSSPFQVFYTYDMDSASATLVFWLWVAACIIGVVRVIKRHTYKESLSIVLLVQFVVSAVFTRWQPWVSRLLMPSLVVALIPIVYFISDSVGEMDGDRDGYRPLLGSAVMGILLLVCLTFHTESSQNLVLNMNYDIYTMDYSVDHFRRYYVFQGKWEPVQTMFDEINALESGEDTPASGSGDGVGHHGPIDEIGLYTLDGSYQYPVLAQYFRDKTVRNVVLDENVDGRIMNQGFEPDAVMVLDRTLDPARTYYCNGEPYVCSWSEADYSLWLREAGNSMNQ